MEKFGSFLKEEICKPPYESTVAFLDLHLRETKFYVHTKTYTWIFIEALFILVPKLDTTQIPLMGKWCYKLWYFCSIEYYTEIKRNKLLIYIVFRMDLKGIMLSQKCSIHWLYIIWSHLYSILKITKLQRLGNRTTFARSQGWNWVGETVKGQYEGSLWLWNSFPSWLWLHDHIHVIKLCGATHKHKWVRSGRTWINSGLYSGFYSCPFPGLDIVL